MRRALFNILLAAMFATPCNVTAQVQDPTEWKYEVKKVKGNEYELIFHLQLKDTWHIYAMKPGGDGSLIPPTFSFDKNASLELKGPMKEKGKPITQTFTGIDGAVTYFNKEVEYIQPVVVKGKTKVTGRHQYQVCTENMCLPPKTKPFEFNIE